MWYNYFGDEMKKLLAIFSSVIATAYTIWYMHFGVPYENSGALSKIGLEHHGLFVVWGVLTTLALGINIVIAYQKYTKTKVYIPLLSVSTVGMVLTLCFDFDFDQKLDYYLHCAGSLTFSAVMGITIFVLFLLNFGKNSMCEAFTYITGGILVVDLICLFIFKETGLIETLPIFAGYLLLGIANLRRDKVETYR